MRFKVDENLPAEVAEEIRLAGGDAETVEEEQLAGTPDQTLLTLAVLESRVLLTMDKGVGNIRSYPPERYAGIVLFRPGSAGRQAVFQFVKRHLPLLLTLDLSGHLVVVGEGGIRTR